jgi:hypothetical protein
MKSYYDRETRLGYFMTIEQEYAYYNEVLERVINNPRKYLDALDDGSLSEFMVSFINYTSTDRRSLKSKKLYK